MKKLITTTAMVLALGLPVTLFAPTVASADTAVTATTATTGFLATRGMNQMLATNLIGHDVYARRTPMEMPAADAKPMTGAAMATLTAADVEGMDKVGQINDLVLSNDGTVAAVVVGVGGFLGVGERDVAVTMNEVSFAANADKPTEMYIVVNTSGDMLKTSPAFDRSAMVNGDAAAMPPAATDQTAATTPPAATDQTAAVTPPAATDQTAATGNLSDRAMLKAPAMERDGYNIVKVSDVSVDTLIGKTVYGTDDKSVGEVDDVTVDGSGAVQNVIIDFGGFLGMGTTKVALKFDELTILTNADNVDIRVYVAATKDQIKAMPVYVPAN
ncbi:MAG: PRC-barrel domain-containing protein [Cypionkella sp.]